MPSDPETIIMKNVCLKQMLAVECYQRNKPVVEAILQRMKRLDQKILETSEVHKRLLFYYAFQSVSNVYEAANPNIVLKEFSKLRPLLKDPVGYETSFAALQLLAVLRLIQRGSDSTSTKMILDSVDVEKIQDPVVSSFYDKLESCYDKKEEYVEERVKSKELVDESDLVRKNILDYITSSEIATLGEAHCETTSSSLVEASVEPYGAAVSEAAPTVPTASESGKPPVVQSSSDSATNPPVDQSSEESSVSSSDTCSSSSETESDVPTTKKQRLNEEHDSAYEESFDSSSEEESIADMVRRISELTRTTAKAPVTKQKRRPWTAEEDELLKKGLKEYGVGNWSIIREIMKLDRSGQQIKDRWRNMIKAGLLLFVCLEEHSS